MIEVQGGEEIIGKRTRHARHFRMPDGRLRCIASPTPINYLDGDQWCPVDLTFRDFKVQECAHITTVSKKAVEIRYVPRSKPGSYVVCRLVEVAGHDLSQARIYPVHDGNTISWPDLFPGLDIVLKAYPSGVEFFKVLKDNLAPVEFVWEYEFSGNPPATVARKTKAQDAGRRPGSKHGTIAPREAQIENTIEVDTPERLRLRERFTGKVVKKDKKRRKSLVSEFKYPVTIDASISENIAAGADDVQENVLTNSLLTANTKIRMGYGPLTTVTLTYPSTYTTFAAKKYFGGFRFQSLAIPSGSTIDSATLTLKRAAVGGGGGTWALQVSLDNVDDAAAWAGTDKPSGISKTGTVPLNLNTSEGYPGATFTADLQTAMQNILNRAGWAGGNDVRALVDINTTGGMSSSRWVECWAYEKTTNIPVLDVTYTPPGQTVQAVWDVAQIQTQTTQAIWNVATNVGKSLQSIWNVSINIDAPATLQLDWDVRSAVGNSLNALWDLEAFGDLVQGFAYVNGPTRPILRAKHANVDLRGKNLVIQIGHLQARVDSMEVVSLAEARARPGKLYAVGIETREKQKGIPAKPDDDAILFTFSLMESGEL